MMLVEANTWFWQEQLQLEDCVPTTSDSNNNNPGTIMAAANAPPEGPEYFNFYDTAIEHHEEQIAEVGRKSYNWTLAMPLAMAGSMHILGRYYRLSLSALYQAVWNPRDIMSHMETLIHAPRLIKNLSMMEVDRSHITGCQKQKLARIVQQHGCELGELSCTTVDGYILLVHRVTSLVKPECYHGTPVFLQHGLKCSSADWVVQRSVFKLVELGYDVYMGNFRGNSFSMAHERLCPTKDKEEFWAFSWDEHGHYDLPAMINLVLEKTGRSKLFYIGHSMGTTAFFVMTHYFPAMADKVEHLMALAPVTRPANAFGPCSWFIPGADALMTLIAAFQGGALMSPKKIPLYTVTAMIVLQATGYHKPDPDNLSEVLTFSPSSTSTQTLKHYIRCLQRDRFDTYDGTMSYSLNHTTCPVDIWWTEKDWASGRKDVQIIRDQLPNVAAVHEITESEFGHLDFLWSKGGKKLGVEVAMRIEEVRLGVSKNYRKNLSRKK